jgi:hypothetical protein
MIMTAEDSWARTTTSPGSNTHKSATRMRKTRLAFSKDRELQVNGPANIPEFGTVRNEEDFHNLLAISAYHLVKDHTAYPAVLLMTGVNDPRLIRGR